eukprot:239505_1
MSFHMNGQDLGLAFDMSTESNYVGMDDEWFESSPYNIIKAVGDFGVAGEYYGQKVVEPGSIYVWRIKLVKTKKTSGEKQKGMGFPYVGIGAFETDQKYLFCGKRRMLSPGEKSYGEKFNKDGSVMIMTLNTKNWTLSYNINNKDYGVAFKYID